MTVTFTNTASNNEPIELQLSGNWIDRYCTIIWKDQPVAQITRDFLNARQILGDADTVSFASALPASLLPEVEEAEQCG
jgi:hypothetical protein